MGKKATTGEQVSHAFHITGIDDPLVAAQFETAFNGMMPLLKALLPPEKLEQIQVSVQNATGNAPEKTSAKAPPQPSSKTYSNRTRYGCLEISENFINVWFGTEPFTVETKTQAHWGLRYLCDKKAIGPDGDYQPAIDMADYIKRHCKLEAQAPYRFNTAFKNHLKPLWQAIEQPRKNACLYRIRADGVTPDQTSGQ